MWIDFVVLLKTYTAELSAAGGLVAIGGVVWAIIKKPFTKDKSVELGTKSLATLSQDKPSQAPPPRTIQMDLDAFEEVQTKLRDAARAEYEKAHGDEKRRLEEKIAELNRRLANPEEALAQQHAVILDLQANLERSGNDIGGDKIAAATKAFREGDLSVADDLFAEIEARRALEVAEAARAAFARGEIAEEEVRWADAAAHYGRAARLDPAFETLRKASEFSERAGDYASAYRHSGDLVDLARTNGDQQRLAHALNEHALNTKALGKFAEAEALFQQAPTIDRATMGEDHPGYATRLNNLAGVVKAQGRYSEAEALYQQALTIGRATIGEEHPDYATRLNNLAGVVRAQGRYSEAEALYQQALTIDRATLGEDHPQFANHLNNLAGVVFALGRQDEALALQEQAVAIALNALGAEHPNTKSFQEGLDNLRAAAD